MSDIGVSNVTKWIDYPFKYCQFATSPSHSRALNVKKTLATLYLKMNGIFDEYDESVFVRIQIPAWIKQELRDVDDGNDAELDDTSDHSDEEVVQKSDLHDSSMSSIQINKDLSHGTISLSANSYQRAKHKLCTWCFRNKSWITIRESNVIMRLILNAFNVVLHYSSQRKFRFWGLVIFSEGYNLKTVWEMLINSN